MQANRTNLEVVDAREVAGADVLEDRPWEVYANGEFVSAHTDEDAAKVAARQLEA